MKQSIDALRRCVLFKNVDDEEILSLLNEISYTIKGFDSDTVIAFEGDPCNSISIILEGNIEIHKPFPSGKVVTINHFEAGDIFAESLVFSKKNSYPANVISSTNSSIMFIPREQLVSLMSKNSNVMGNFAGVLSSRIHMLNDRITSLSLETTRKKIVNIILLEYGRQKSLYLTLPYSRKKMAELLNIPRPSLSRELIKMKEDGLIDFYKNRIKILNLNELERSLL